MIDNKYTVIDAHCHIYPERIAAAAINNVRFVDGLIGIFKKNITADTAVSLSLAIALVRNMLAAFIGGNEVATTVFSAAAVGAVLISKIAE